MIKYSVKYTDDTNRKHLAFISSIEEFKMLKERFFDAFIFEFF